MWDRRARSPLLRFPADDAHGRRKTRGSPAVRQDRYGHGFARGSDRSADAPDQSPDRAPARAQGRPPPPPRPADAGRPAPPPAQLPRAQGPRPLPRAHQGTRPAPMIEPGSPAPDFALPDQDGNIVKLEDLRGQTTVLVFYPLDFSPVCTDQLNVYQEVEAELDAQLYGISVDSAFAHKAFQQQLGISFPLLADFHPKGEVSRAYGVYIEERGHNQRALVLIGPDLEVKWSYMSPTPLEIPGANLIFDAIHELQAA